MEEITIRISAEAAKALKACTGQRDTRSAVRALVRSIMLPTTVREMRLAKYQPKPDVARKILAEAEQLDRQTKTAKARISRKAPRRIITAKRAK